MDLGNFFLKSFSSIFIIITPFLALPIFISLTAAEKEEIKNEIAFKSVMVAAIFLLLFIAFGNNILNLFGISEEALKISGGLILFVFSLQFILCPENYDNRSKKINDRNEIYVFPLGIPVIAGPGAMTYIIMLSNEAKNIHFMATITLALSLVCALFFTYVILILGDYIFEKLGNKWISILQKISGIILAAISIQIIMNGLNKI